MRHEEQHLISPLRVVLTLWLLVDAMCMDHIAAGRQAYARGDLNKAREHFNSSPVRSAEVNGPESTV